MCNAQPLRIGMATMHAPYVSLNRLLPLSSCHNKKYWDGTSSSQTLHTFAVHKPVPTRGRGNNRQPISTLVPATATAAHAYAAALGKGNSGQALELSVQNPQNSKAQPCTLQSNHNTSTQHNNFLVVHCTILYTACVACLLQRTQESFAA